MFPIPYAGAKILAVFELNAIPIKFDCRKGQCKSCLVKVTLEGESGETLACMEDALEGMEIDTRGFQPETAIPAVPPMETKRVTTRKITKKPLSEVNRANGKVFKILCQAQEAALDGEWEGCSDYAAELIEIANHFDQPDERQAVFLTGPCRDLLRDFTAVLRTSGQVRFMVEHQTNPKSGEWVAGDLGFGTKLVHSGTQPDAETGAILSPIVLSTTFVQESVEQYMAKGYSYSRSSNPTVSAYERRLAAVENGVGAAAFSTGMAATATAICSFMKAGDHALITACSYGGTNRIMRMLFKDMGMEFSFLDFRDLDAIKNAIIPNKTKVILSESPANPLLQLNDIEAISAIAKQHKLIHMCDATFATPVVCRPLDLGADITLQSTTKYYDGHDMTTGGALICRTQELLDRILFVRNMLGNIMAPMTAFLQLQTCKTMELRVRRQCETALTIAKFLESHPKVTKVVYPGLASFPQKALADKQHRDGLHGGMLWFEIKGGSEAGTLLMNTVQRPWSLCENLGATESIITACAVMTHANMLKEDRIKLGITDGFIRVSCGIEDANDLIRALEVALAAL